MTAQELRDFETEIGDCFRQKQIRAPIHLYDGNEDKIIEIFEQVKPDDWVFCTWRSHYQCLLKGVPKDRLKKDIIAGRSISLCYPDYNLFSSAIVTGILPIANGVAFDIKYRGLKSHVWCFVGDMAAETGCFHENWKYACNFELPITFIIEDNGKSVCTDTRKTWGYSADEINIYTQCPKIIYYQYNTKYPHAGVGERIQF